ncbi:hypothetical protein O181_013446 [Austropuccinia psidii MF-1]|uniref:Uncharacterized protein n=1 Tax=Austropuccinia psidii MF-1 TaxID=1389203 RepID=A0A9Q3BWF0_9BASI|nr:hypothetical protein [Austropuccinia psidii MF-1]
MAHVPHSMGLLGPFWLKYNEAKRGQVGPPEPVLAPKPNQPRNGQTTLGPKIGHSSAHGLWKPLEATSSAPRKYSPQFQEKTFPSSSIQEWCICGIIYHYAPFLLSNPMVRFSGQNYMIPNQVPNPSPIFKEDFSAIQYGNSLVATRRPFEDPNHLALQELGCQFPSGLF